MPQPSKYKIYATVKRSIKDYFVPALLQYPIPVDMIIFNHRHPFRISYNQTSFAYFSNLRLACEFAIVREGDLMDLRQPSQSFTTWECKAMFEELKRAKFRVKDSVTTDQVEQAAGVPAE
jgi:hypothetical protein